MVDDRDHHRGVGRRSRKPTLRRYLKASVTIHGPPILYIGIPSAASETVLESWYRDLIGAGSQGSGRLGRHRQVFGRR